MKQRTKSLPVLVVFAVLALILGSIGTAVAAPALTKGKVKAIATKVVKKLAPTLSVAHATTATTATNANNATTLNGLASTAYQTPAYSFTWPTTAAAGSITKTIPAIPAGNYVVHVDFIANTTDTTRPVFCFVFQGANVLGSSNGSTFGPLATVSFSRVVTITGAATSMNCQTNGGALLSTPYNAGQFGISSVSFSKVDSVTAGSTSKGADGKVSSNGAPAAQ